MNELQAINAVVSLGCVAALSVVVLNTEIKEGPMLKLGLLGMIFSNLITAMLIFEGSQNWQAFSLVGLLNRAGMLFVCIGFVNRARNYAKTTTRVADPKQRTRQILRSITEPIEDLAHLFRASEPAALEETKDKR